MEDFNAQQAKQIVDSLYTNELHNLLLTIKEEAEQGKSILHVHCSLKGKTIEALKSKGFEVIIHPSIAVQRENLHYSISWK